MGGTEKHKKCHWKGNNWINGRCKEKNRIGNYLRNLVYFSMSVKTYSHYYCPSWCTTWLNFKHKNMQYAYETSV